MRELKPCGMPQSKRSLLARFLIWRAKHISQREFVYILSIIVGFTSGLGAVILKNLTHYIQLLLEGKLIQKYSEAAYFVFPLIGFVLVYLMMKYVIGNKVNHGIPSTLFAISKRKGLMERYQMVGSILTAPLTVGFGGSVGLEGPTVSTGAAISSNISRLFHMNQATRTLLIGAAAAGAMSSIFKAPIAAIIFAIEVMSLDLTLASMLPLLLASISGVLTSYFFFGSDILLPFDLQDDFIVNDIPYFMLLGIVAAGVSIYFTKVYASIQYFFDRINGPIKRLFIGGVAIGVIVFLVPPLYGEGYELMNNMVQGNPTAALKNNILNIDLSNIWGVIILLVGLLLFKIVASAITFGAGGVGGIFAPTLFMGCIMGNCL